MKFRKLRIAWSVVWGWACVFLIVVSVRSYWRFIGVRGMIDNRLVIVETERGESTLNVVPSNKLTFAWYTLPLSSDAKFKPLPVRTRGGFGLRWWSYRNGFGGKISLFNLLMIGAVLCILPWLGKFRRYSLRTLLIATTLIALLLGLAIYATG